MRILCLVALLSSFALRAEDEKPTFSAAHLAAAGAVVELSGVESSLAKTADAMFANQVKAKPALKAFEDIFRAFFRKHLAYETMKPAYVQLYAETFTEEELLAIADFYRSDAGRKMSAKSGELLAKGAAIGDQRLRENLPELQEAIKARVAAIQAAQEEAQKAAKPADPVPAE